MPAFTVSIVSNYGDADMGDNYVLLPEFSVWAADIDAAAVKAAAIAGGPFASILLTPDTGECNGVMHLTSKGGKITDGPVLVR